MKPVSITYNMALELIVAIDKYVSMSCNIVDAHVKEASIYAKLEAESYIDFAPNPDIKKWIDDINQSISPFFKNDIAHFLGLRPAYLMCFSQLILKHQLQTPTELMDFVTLLTPDALMIQALACYSDTLTPSDPLETIAQEITKICGEDESHLFLYLLQHPDEFKSKSLMILQTFYQLFFMPHENHVREKLEEKQAAHQLQLEQDQQSFISTIGLGDYSKVMDKDYKIVMYISYYLDLGVSYKIEEQTCYIQYGVSMEQRFNHVQMEIKYKNLFKALSDDTRREIIRLTSVRPWYNRELAEHFGLTSATLSYHLNMLLDLDILRFDPSDNYRFYYIANKEKIKALFKYMLVDLVGE